MYRQVPEDFVIKGEVVETFNFIVWKLYRQVASPSEFIPTFNFVMLMLYGKVTSSSEFVWAGRVIIRVCILSS